MVFQFAPPSEENSSVTVPEEYPYASHPIFTWSPAPVDGAKPAPPTGEVFLIERV